MDIITIKAKKNDAGKRLDNFLVDLLPEISRAKVQKAIKSADLVLVNGKKRKPSYIICAEDKIKYHKEIGFKKQLKKILPEKKLFEIIFENNNYIAVNKEAGLSVHGTGDHHQNNLINRIIAYCPKINEVTFDKSEISKFRPGIIHRLDKDTTGVIIFAKNIKSLEYLANQIRNRQVTKIYHTLVYGWPQKTGELRSKLSRDKKNRLKMTEGLEGKIALSNYKTLNYFQTKKDKQRLALLEINLSTGRTHQIRVQLKGLGFPVVGDKIYKTQESELISKKLGVKRQLLHAKRFEFNGSNRIVIKIQSNLPKDFKKILSNLIEIK